MNLINQLLTVYTTWGICLQSSTCTLLITSVVMIASLECHECMQLKIASRILHDTYTSTMVRSIYMTFLEVAARTSKELQDTPDLPLRRSHLSTAFHEPDNPKTCSLNPLYGCMWQRLHRSWRASQRENLSSHYQSMRRGKTLQVALSSENISERRLSFRLNRGRRNYQLLQ